MTPNPCVDPEIGERAIESARGGARALSPELAAHVTECAECAVAVERAARIAAVIRKDEPSRAAVAAAHARFLARRGRGGLQRRVIPLVVAFASLLCTALAFAAGVRYAVVHGFLSAPVVESVASDPAAPAPTSRSRKHARGTGAAPPIGALPVPSPAPVEADAVDAGAEIAAVPEAMSVPEVAPVPAPVAIVADPAPSPRRSALPPAPRPAEMAVVSALPTRAHVSHDSSPTPAPDPASIASPTAAPVRAPSPWVVAANAMRAKDFATAERAFSDLAASPDPKTRDEARLARAQVWLAQGRAGAARPELTALAASGSTPIVRQRAADALRALSAP